MAGELGDRVGNGPGLPGWPEAVLLGQGGHVKVW